VSQWLLLNSENPTGEQCAVIAHHAELAGHPEIAARFLWRSGEKARRMGQPRERLFGLSHAATLVPATDLALRIHIALDLGEALRSLSGDIEGATNCFEEALHLAWRMRHRGKAADALSRIGMLETDRGLFDAASEHLELALRLYEAINDRKGVAATCIHLGRMLWLHGRFSEALHSYRKSESLYRALRDDRGLADTEHAVATLYYDQGELALAEEHYLKVLALREKTQDEYERASVMNNLGAVWAARGEQERAIETWRDGLKLASELGHRSLEATLSNNLGEGLMHLRQFEDAEPYIDNAIVLAHATEHIRLIIDAYTNRAFIHMQQRNWSGAECAIEQAILENRKSPVPKQSGQVYRCQGDLAFIRGSQKSADKGSSELLLEEAVSHFMAAIHCFEEADYDLEAANTHEKLGDLYAFLGRKKEEKTERETAASLRGKHDMKEKEG
jgi:tetratricopeptide (TPR) repeat protein